MDIVKIAVLLLMALVLAVPLESAWVAETDLLPKVYLNIKDVNQYEEKQGSLTVGGKHSSRDVGVLVRVRGNSTVWTEKQSYSVRFIKKTSLLGMGKSGRWILLGVPFDKTLIRTPLGFEYAKALGMENVSQFTHCELYLNGEYRGLYMLVRPITLGNLSLNPARGDFILERNIFREEKDARYVETEGEIRFEINAGELADDSFLEQCLSRVNLAEAYIQSGNESQYAELIDVDSFVNAYIIQEVVKHTDFAEASDRYYMKNGKIYAGPIWDLDLSMGNVSRNSKVYYNAAEDEEELHDSAEMLWAQRDWYEWLCQDPAFMKRVCERWREVYPITENLVYDNELGKNRIDAWVEKYAQAIQDNYDESRAWSMDEKYSWYEYDEAFSTYEDAVEHLRDWLIYRIEWLDEEFAWIEEGL